MLPEYGEHDCLTVTSTVWLSVERMWKPIPPDMKFCAEAVEGMQNAARAAKRILLCRMG